MFSRTIAAALSPLCVCLILAELPTPFILQDGTAIRVRINRNLSSADAQVGENVDFQVLDDIRVGDVLVIPRGSAAFATVTAAQAKRRMARGGKLSVNIDYVRLANGDKATLRGVKDLKGGGHTGAMTGAMIATGIVFFPAAPLFLFMKGKDITIPKGHEVTVYINGDVRLDRAKFWGAPAAVTATTPPVVTDVSIEKSLTNEDVIALKNAGLGDNVIVSKIRSAKGAYKLGPTELIQLKESGLSDSVIAAMLDATKN
jgi:hypothetical protein